MGSSLICLLSEKSGFSHKECKRLLKVLEDILIELKATDSSKENQVLVYGNMRIKPVFKPNQSTFPLVYRLWINSSVSRPI